MQVVSDGSLLLLLDRDAMLKLHVEVHKATDSMDYRGNCAQHCTVMRYTRSATTPVAGDSELYVRGGVRTVGC